MELWKREGAAEPEHRRQTSQENTREPRRTSQENTSETETDIVGGYVGNWVDIIDRKGGPTWKKVHWYILY